MTGRKRKVRFLKEESAKALAGPKENLILSATKSHVFLFVRNLYYPAVSTCSGQLYYCAKTLPESFEKQQPIEVSHSVDSILMVSNIGWCRSITCCDALKMVSMTKKHLNNETSFSKIYSPLTKDNVTGSARCISPREIRVSRIN